MSGTIYLYLLILCGIWSQGFIRTLADEEIEGSSDILVRQKRVVGYVPGGAIIRRIEEQPYIVRIKRLGRIYCTGAILSHRIVITTAECAEFAATQYKVLAKSSHSSNVGSQHIVTNIKLHNSNITGRPLDGIALMTINPEFVYTQYISNIELHLRPLPPTRLATVSGWGYNFKNRVTGPGTSHPANLRSIEVPIISYENCVNSYLNYYPITDRDICTFHPQKHCGHTDRGAPLVINNLLVGIFLRSGPVEDSMNCQFPEIYAFLPHTYYSNWIRANM